MKIILNQSEVDSVVEYIRTKQCNPCVNCSNIRICNGCPKQEKYCSTLNELEPSNHELLNIKTLVSYAETIATMENIPSQINKLKREYEELNEKSIRLKSLLIIENNSGEE